MTGGKNSPYATPKHKETEGKKNETTKAYHRTWQGSIMRESKI